LNHNDKVTINGREYTVTYNGNNVVNSTDANTPPSPGGFGGTGGPGEPIDITAKKVWDDSKAEESVSHPTIWFKLYRSLRGSMEPVPGAEIKALTPGVTEVTWHGIEKVNASGETYTFEVKEVDATGFDFTPEGYEKSENGLTVTNTYKGETEGKTDRIAGQKFWILDDPAQRPSAVTVILYRDGEEIARKIITAQEDWKYDFGEHVIEEENGTKHVYTIGEVVPDGYQMIRHKQYSLVNMGSRGTKDPAIPTVPVLKMKRLPRAGAL